MDRHDIPEEITAKEIAEMHVKDLGIEHLYNCRGITYWCDVENHHAFCLVEAPDLESIQKMHNHAHGEFPSSIIEVDEKLVASFLGRIDDPEGNSDSDSLIIDDSALRTIMVVETNNYLNRIEANQLNVFTQKFHKSVLKSIKKFDGSIINQNDCRYLISFKSNSNAIYCALKIQSDIKYITPKFDQNKRLLNIAISTGTPVTEKKTLFEEAIELTARMCDVVNGRIVISNEVENLFKVENLNYVLDKNIIRTLQPLEEKFLTQLMDYIENIWSTSNIKVESLSSELGYSKSQLYRKLKSLTNKSPNSFIKDIKLNKSLSLFHNKLGNVSEIAFEVGFNSPAYFTKCFYEKFGILPSKYTQQHIY